MAKVKIFIGDSMKSLDIIKFVRKQKHISQDTMAEKLRMARSTYQAIESGQNNMNINDFFKIIEILEIPITEFSENELIVIEKKDLEKILLHTEELNKIAKKIESSNNIQIGNNNNIQIGSNINFKK